MLLTRFLTTALSVCLAAGFAVAEPTKGSANSGTKTSVKARKSGSKSRASRNRSSGRPRQMTPTAERYMEIQQALADQGYYSGEINGIWGLESVDALKRFQADQNLKVDGKLGALSLIALGLGPKRQAGDALTTKPETSEQ